MASGEDGSGQRSLNDTSYAELKNDTQKSGAGVNSNPQQNQTGRVVCGPTSNVVTGGRLSGTGNVPTLSPNHQMNLVRRLDFDNVENVHAGNLDSSRRTSQQQQQQQQQQSMNSGMYESSSGTFPDSGRGTGAAVRSGSGGFSANQNQTGPQMNNSVVSGGCNNGQSSAVGNPSGIGNSSFFQQQTPSRSYNIDSYSIPLHSTPDPRPPEQRSFQNQNRNLNESLDVSLPPIQPPSFNLGHTFESGASSFQFNRPQTSPGQGQRLSGQGQGQGSSPNRLSFVGQNFLGQAAMDVPPDELAVVNANMRKIMARVAFNVVNNRMNGLWEDLMQGMNNHFMDFLIANLVPIIENLMMAGEWPWSFCQCCAARNRQQQQEQNVNMRGRGPQTAGAQQGQVQRGTCQGPCPPGQGQGSTGISANVNDNRNNVNQTITLNRPPPGQNQPQMTSSQNPSPRNSVLNPNASNPPPQQQQQQPLPFASNSYYDNINPCPRLDGSASSNCGCPMGNQN